MHRRLAGCAGIVLVTHSLAMCSASGIETGRHVQGVVGPEGTQVLQLDLAANQAARLLVEQIGADLVLTVQADPDGGSWAIDMRERGRESVTLIANSPTRFSVTLTTKAPTAGARYEAYLEGAPGHASERDQKFMEAELLETKGKALATDPRGSKLDAEQALLGAARHWQAAGDPTGQGTTAARLGDIQFSRGQLGEAIEFYHDAVTHLSPLNVPHQIAAIENNLGAVYEQLGSFDDARRHFSAALNAWAAQPGAEVDHAITRANEGAMYLRFGDYHAALSTYLAALPQLEKSNRLNPAVLNNIGMVYRTMGDPDAAERYFERTLESLPDSHPRRAHLRLRIAQVALDRGDAVAAERESAAALTQIRSGTNVDPIAEADALGLYGQALTNLGRMDEALASHQQSLKLYESAGARRNAASARHEIGIVYRRRGRVVAARQALNHALKFRQSIGLRDAEAETQYELGLLEAQTARLREAGVHYSAAIELAEGIRGRVAGEYSRAAYSAARHRYFTAYVDVLMRMHARSPGLGFADRAFELVERQQARGLTDLLRDSGVDAKAGVDPALVERGRLAQRQLDFWAGQVARLSNQPADAAPETAAAAKMTDAILSLREIDGLIRGSAGRTERDGGPDITLRDVQRRVVGSDTRLVTYSLGEPRSYAWVVAPDRVRVMELASRSRIEAVAGRLLSVLREPPSGTNPQRSVEDFNRLASELSGLVIAPIRPWLDTEHVLLVADGILQSIPFAALPDPGDGEPLLEHFQIAIAPSASTILIQRERLSQRPRATRPIAVVADAVYERADPRIRRQAPPVGAPDQFGRLMLAQAEADWILRLTDRRSSFRALGFQANVDAVLDNVGDSRIVHFAAHAIANDVWPELSGIALSMYDSRGQPREGMLRLHQITGALDLRAELVVLSACSTADGRHLAGEGVIGLARGFLAAGASSVIGSLNTVLEEPTFEFMKALYSAMFDRGLPPATALREAQRSMRRQGRFSHPSYWSAFVFIGDPR